MKLYLPSPTYICGAMLKHRDDLTFSLKSCFTTVEIFQMREEVVAYFKELIHNSLQRVKKCMESWFPSKI
jgi:hypothetical protein